MNSIKLREFQNKSLKITLKDDLDNDILTLEFDKPNISLKSFLKHLDLKLYPLKCKIFKQYKPLEEDTESFDYILFTYKPQPPETEEVPIMISEDMIINLSILHLLEIYNYNLSEDLIIRIKNHKFFTDYNDALGMKEFITRYYDSAVSAQNIELCFIKIFQKYKYLMFYILFLNQKYGSMEYINYNVCTSGTIAYIYIDQLIMNIFMTNINWTFDATERGLLIFNNPTVLLKILQLDSSDIKQIFETHPNILDTLHKYIYKYRYSDRARNELGILISRIVNSQKYFEEAIKYFPDNIKYIENSNLRLTADIENGKKNRNFLRYSIIKYNCPLINYIDKLDSLSPSFRHELIFLSIKKSYTNIKYIGSNDKNTELYRAFLDSFIKVNGYNFQLINIIDSKLFANPDFIQTCLDKKLGKHIINFINDETIKASFKLRLDFIRNNCYKDMVEKGITFSTKENVINILLNEGFIYEALDILKNIDELSQEQILLIIRTKQIDKIRELNVIKEINNSSSINYADLNMKNVIIEIIENGLLMDLIKMSVINSPSFVIFLEKNNLIDKLDKFTRQKMMKKTMKELLNV